jgi:hypothetical protein
MDEPLDRVAAKRLVAEIMENGTWVVSPHAREEMAKDDMSDQDAINILRAGVYGEAEWENGRWRYRAWTARMVVIFQFESETELRLITAWRDRR